MIELTKYRISGGCQAKLDSKKLSKILKNIPPIVNENLLVGYSYADDAGIYQLTESLALVQTVDFFPPLVDDPYVFGQIAATNALSDVYAMGGTPITAMNIVCFPDELDSSILEEILKGGAAKIQEAGCVLCGGHSVKDKEPKYGLSVTGVINPNNIFKNNTAKIGDVILLLKPLGTGIIVSSHLEKACSKNSFDAAVSSMCLLNKYAQEILKEYENISCTDVTGFGLVGHLSEMLQGNNRTAGLDSKAIPYFDEAYALASDTRFSCGGNKNRLNNSDTVRFHHISDNMQNLLFDPQTSGGFLVTVPQKDADSLLKQLQKYYISASVIGAIKEYSGFLIEVR